VGDDANPCSRTAPCKTFAGAISKTAAGGLIDCIDPGGFGGLTITKAITIDCGQTFGSVLVSGTNGITVAAGGSDTVTLRNLDITGIGTGLTGISFVTGGTLHVENVTISKFLTNCIGVSASTNVSMTVKNVTMTGCSANGINTITSTGTVNGDIRNVLISNTPNGINAQNGSRLSVTDSTIFAATVAVNETNVSGTPAFVMVSRSTFSLNGTALQSTANGIIYAFANNFFANALIFNPNGGSIGTGADNSPAANGTTGVANGGTVTKI
jgi:hypothetical protein